MKTAKRTYRGKLYAMTNLVKRSQSGITGNHFNCLLVFCVSSTFKVALNIISYRLIPDMEFVFMVSSRAI